jgi:hypothetical protein
METLEMPLAPGAESIPETRTETNPARPGTLRLDFALEPRRVGLWLAGFALGLAFCHIVTVVWHYEYSELPWAFRGLFDLDEEESFGTWFSSGLLLLAGLSSMLCARRAGQTGQAMRLQWWCLGFGFVLLSVDEVAGMHESVNSVTEMSWAIPGGILAVVIGLAYLPFLFRLPRPIAVLFLVAGTIYVGGAVGVELATEGYLERDELDTVEYNLTTALEEWMEMTGVVLFLYAVLRHLSFSGGLKGAVQVGAEPSS